jgi:CubicO group peptidase (beta-lactamase class C family)
LLIICGALLVAPPCCGGNADAQGSTEQVWPTHEWQTSSPEDEGMDSAMLAKLVAFGTTRSFDSLLIARHGRIVLDAYYAPYTADIPHAINSSTKAVIGTLIAMAHKDGLLDRLDHPMLDFFPGRDIANVDDRKRAITVQNLLDMTSGLEWEEGTEGGREQSLIDLGRAKDWTQFILDRPMAHQPGEIFYYNSGNPDLLSAIITKLTRKRAAHYAQEKLFGPLGIDPPFWRRDPQGLTIGACCLFLSPHDMAKIGYLYLHMANGRESSFCRRSGSRPSATRPSTCISRAIRVCTIPTCSGPSPTSTSTWRSDTIASCSWCFPMPTSWQR